MKTVKLKVDFASGKRAGNVDPKSKYNYCCPTWQDLENGYEIRMLPDDEAERIRDMEGVTVYNNEVEAEKAISRYFPDKVVWKVTNEALLKRSVEQLNIDVTLVSQDATHEEELEFLYNAGARGIGRTVRPRSKVDDARKSFIEVVSR